MAKVPVFISWSGPRSKAVANAMRQWLEDVLQGTKPWISHSDIDKGARWGQEIAEQLQASSIGIICVTPENLTSPWLLFEAGALSKKVGATYVCTLLLDIAPGAVPPPLGTFQATQTSKDDVLSLLSTINGELGEDALAPEQLGRIFARSWPELEQRFTEIREMSADTPKTNRRDTNDVLEELVQLVRGVDSRLARISASGGYGSRLSLGSHVAGSYPEDGARASSGLSNPAGNVVSTEVDDFVSQAKAAVVREEQARRPPVGDD